MVRKKLVIGYYGHTFWAISARPLGGVLEYCGENRNIELRDFSIDHMRAVEHRHAPPWKGLVDGVLLASGFGGNVEDVLAWIAAGGTPAVSVTSGTLHARLPVVFTDPKSIARLALKELLRCGCTRFLFVGLRAWPASLLREDAFRCALAGHGHDCSAFACPETPLDPKEPVDAQVRDELVKALCSGGEVSDRHGRPGYGPIGVLTLNDPLARLVVQVCGTAGLRIPEEVAVVGVDDTPLSFDRHPTITSVCCPGEAIGQRATELLVKLIEGGRRPRKPIQVPARKIAVRETTGATAEPDDVALALDLIQRQASSGATIEELTQQLPVSRRTLERAFRERLGRSPAYEMQRVRLAYARTLLENTEFSIRGMARHVGFANHGALSNFFYRQTGMWPTDYRMQCRQQAEEE